MKNFSDMRNRITFQSQSVIADEAGGQLITWVSGQSVWAEIKALSGNGEKFANGRMGSDEKFKITIRHINGIVPSMRIVYGSRIFNITKVTNIDEKNCWLEIIAEEST